MDSVVVTKVSQPSQPNFIEDLQVRTLNKLLDIGKINQLLAATRQFGKEPLGVDEYIDMIHQSVWKELKTGAAIDPYRRNLQKSYVGALQDILTSNKPEVTETDVYSVARADFQLLLQELRQAIPRLTDRLGKYHLQDMEVRVKNTLDAKISMQ